MKNELSILNAKLKGKVIELTAALQTALYKLAVVNNALETFSTVDGLTGLKNRRFFRESFCKEWEQAHRYELPISFTFA